MQKFINFVLHYIADLDIPIKRCVFRCNKSEPSSPFSTCILMIGSMKYLVISFISGFDDRAADCGLSQRSIIWALGRIQVSLTRCCSFALAYCWRMWLVSVALHFNELTAYVLKALHNLDYVQNSCWIIAIMERFELSTWTLLSRALCVNLCSLVSIWHHRFAIIEIWRTV